MKAAKAIGIAVVVYVGIVVLFESGIGYFQPENDGSLVITTKDEDGGTRDRVVSRIESRGQLYVAANHWPRAWYRRALATPEVEVTLDAAKGRQPYLAVAVDDDEYARVNGERGLPLPFRILTGFPPREILRLDPR